MRKVEFNVPDMSCTHCVKAIETALNQLNGVDSVNVDLPGKRVGVEYDPGAMSPDVLAEALASAGYPVK